MSELLFFALGWAAGWAFTKYGWPTIRDKVKEAWAKMFGV